ncbi:MAG: response regulator [candidate division Zixibacteria bacterium]|nr:response regulator [candidate division Zixibacteria bacterium]
MKSKISILAVDDEEMLRNLLVKILAKEGYQVDTAIDGEDALEKLETKEYNLLISDIKMPRLNGFELLKIVRKKHSDMGIIMMTAYGDSFSVKDALLLGADEYITKPFKSFEINLIVERAYWRLMSGKIRV